MEARRTAGGPPLLSHPGAVFTTPPYRDHPGRDEMHARQVCGLPGFESFVPHGDPGSPLTPPPAKRPVSRGTEPAQEPSGSPHSSLVAHQVSGAPTCADGTTSQETFYLKRRCLATQETDCVCLVPRKTSRKLSKGQILMRQKQFCFPQSTPRTLANTITQTGVHLGPEDCHCPWTQPRGL